MAERLAVIITSLTVFFCLIGCPAGGAGLEEHPTIGPIEDESGQGAFPEIEPEAPPAVTQESGPLGTPQVKAAAAEAEWVESDEAEPNDTGAGVAEGRKDEPNAVATSTEPQEGEQVAVEPNQAAATVAEPGGAEPNTAEPIAVETLGPEPNEPALSAAQTGESEPNIVEPNEATPIAAEPNQPEPAESEPNSPGTNRDEPNDIEPKEVASVPIEPNEPNNVEPVKGKPNDANAAPNEPNGPKPDSATAFHNKCADIFKQYVNDRGLVDYRTLTRKKLELKAVLAEFDNLDPNLYESWSREDKIALWINAYNIQMLKIITDNYPIKPSRILVIFWGHRSILYIDGIWTKYKFKVMDGVYTLSEVDKQILRKRFGDPRVFFALSRASLSGPPLRNEPYYGSRLDKQLDDQVKKFLADPLAFSVHENKQKVYLWPLFQISEYGKEFIPKYGIDRKFKEQVPATRAVLNFITNYVSEDVVSFLEVGNYAVQFIKYDWTLNDDL